MHFVYMCTWEPLDNKNFVPQYNRVPSPVQTTDSPQEISIQLAKLKLNEHSMHFVYLLGNLSYNQKFVLQYDIAPPALQTTVSYPR